MLLIDAANVIGSRPTGWWRDRAGAARRFVGSVRVGTRAGHVDAPVVVVTADRELAERVRSVGADVRGPSWLLERLDRS